MLSLKSVRDEDLLRQLLQLVKPLQLGAPRVEPDAINLESMIMRPSVPDADLARTIDIAVTEKLERVEAKRFGKARGPRRNLAETDTTPSSVTSPPR